MKTIAILTAIHNRREIAEIYANRLNRAICNANVTNKYVPYAVLTIHESIPKDMEDYSITWAYNEPLGRKWNIGMQDVANYVSPDYVMILGSDDLISSSFLEHIDHKINQGYELIGIRDLYFYSLNPRRIKYGECGYWAGRGKLLGVGRTVHRRLLEKVDWAPWGETKNSGLDGSMLKNIRPYLDEGKMTTFTLKETGTYCLDIKTEGNINGIGNFDIEPMPPEELMGRFMDKDEIEAVIKYRDTHG